MSEVKKLLLMRPETIVVDKYGGAEFTIVEITQMVGAMLATDSNEEIEKFCERFVVKGDSPRCNVSNPQ